MMRKEKPHAMVHLLILIFNLFFFLLTSSYLVLGTTIAFYFIYILLFQVDIKYFGIHIKWSIVVSLFLSALIFCFSRTILSTSILFIKTLFLLQTFQVYIHTYTWMEIYYTLERICYPLEFVCISSSKFAWFITKFIRNIQIWCYNVVGHQEFYRISKKRIEKNTIYDKMENIRDYFRMIQHLTNQKIQRLDEMMYLRLFRVWYGRTNYHVNRVKKTEIIFVIFMLVVVISEVIL